ncbi:MAG TPA: cytochrome c oxidase subunit II [Pseudonocardiaceae bacterium]|nr:cytochrome c oxidase subunit II [Pseudonocardiaceae bacterium]
MGRKQGTRPGRLAKVIGLVVLVALSASACNANVGVHFGWPEAITPQGDRMRDFWMWSAFASLAVGLVVWGLTIWTVSFHRKRRDSGVEVLPRQFQYSGSLEFILVVVPLVIVSVLFYFTVTTQNYVLKKVPDPNLTVGVIAFQWNWEFDYNGYQTPDGQVVRTVGSSQEIPLLVLPTNEVIQYDLRSTDVIHSFFVPAFNFKRDVFPDPDKNNQDSSFQNTIDKTGSFVGRCAELCGTYHSMMNFEVRSVPQDIFNHYMQLRSQTDPQTNLPYSAAEALAKTGQDMPSCGQLCSPVAVTTHPFDTSRTSRQASN